MKKISLIIGLIIGMGTLEATEMKPIPKVLTSCVGCHGVLFDKHAMGKSKVVSEMSRIEIEYALKGYKNGTYGGAMKVLMKTQIDRFNDGEIVDIAALIKIGENKIEDSNSTDSIH